MALNRYVGPWRSRVPRGYIVCDSGNRVIAEVYGDNSGDHALLIEAAPDLLLILKELAAFNEPDSLHDQDSDAQLRDAHRAVWARARALLEKICSA